MAKLEDIGGEPVNRSEQEMIQLLVEGLPDEYVVIPNAVIAQRGRQPYEYDAIVVAPHAVYVVEIKGWRGEITQVSNKQWRLASGEYRDNPLHVNDEKAKVLASKLEGLDLSGEGGEYRRRPYVQSCLLGASENVEFDVGQEAARCFTPSQITAYLQDHRRLDCRPPERFKYRDSIDEIAAFIADRTDAREGGARSYGNFEVVEPVDLGDEDPQVYRARWKGLSDNHVYRIRTWYLSPYMMSEKEREERSEILKRSAEALARIGSHPNLVELKDFGEQGSEFYEVASWSDRGTLETVNSTGKSRQWSLRRKLEVLRGIARGLEAAEDAGVMHRNLNPAVILLGPDGSPKIGDFDRAFMTAASRTVYGDTYEPGQNDYLAPELRDSSGYETRANSDVYSLGIIAYEIFTSYTPSMNPGALEKISSEWPDELRGDLLEFVDAMSSSDPDERPVDPSEAVSEFERLIGILDGGTRDDREVVETPTDVHFETGEWIDGINRVEGLLAEGASSRVYRVRNEIQGGEYALKVADPEKTEALGGPAREFELLRDISHSGVVRAEWAGRLGEGGEEAPTYLLMECLDGPSLSAEIEQSAPLDAETALEWTIHLLEALETIHPEDGVTTSSGGPALLHRDIKPENVIISERGPVLVDFGSAVPSGEAGRAPVGSLRYAPPDLSEGDGWNAGCDLFSIGCMLYQMLTGAPPWGSNIPSTEKESTPLIERLEALGSATEKREHISDVVDRAIAPRSEQRFAAASDFIDALESASSRPKTPYNPTPHIASTASEAGDAVWTADFVRELIQDQRPERILYEAMREVVYRGAADPKLDELEAIFLDAEARALALEEPLPDLFSTFYDSLAEGSSPIPVRGAHEGGAAESDHEPRKVEICDSDALVVLNGLHHFEVANLVSRFDMPEFQVREFTWQAGSMDPEEPDERMSALKHAFTDVPGLQAGVDVDGSAFREILFDADAVTLELPPGRRGDEGLVRLLERRQGQIKEVSRAISDALKTDESAAGRVWVTSTYGSIYLGHGLRVDVGAGCGGQADGVRGRWSTMFSNGRVGRGPEGAGEGWNPELEAATTRPYRVEVADYEPGRARVFPVGRLAWPDPPDARRLARGGMSVPERLLPLICLETSD